MDIRAHVQVDFARMGVAVTVYQRTDTGVRIYLPGGETTFPEWRETDPTVVSQDVSYRFDDDVAKALLDALLDHYRGGHDARQLRKDYDAERARVDKLIDATLRRPGPPR